MQEVDGIVFDRTVTPPRMEIAFGDILIDSQRFHLRRDEHGRFSVPFRQKSALLQPRVFRFKVEVTAMRAWKDIARQGFQDAEHL